MMQTTSGRPLTALLFALLLAGCSRCSAPLPAASSTQVPSVTVADGSSFYSIPGAFRVYALDAPGVHGKLRVSRSQDAPRPQLFLSLWSGPGPENFAADPKISIQRRMEVFLPLFQRYLKDGGPGSTFDLQVYGFREFDERLTCLAERDRGWDRHKGQPVKASLGYRYYEQLLQHGDAGREVQQALQHLGYRATLTGGLENLRVLRVSEFSSDQRTGLCTSTKEHDLLPVRVSVTFTATRMTH